MLRRCHKLKGYHLGASDGEIGKLEDFYFDDQNWTVRYVVADTGYWLPDRLVLISPHALTAVDDAEKVVRIRLTRNQVEESPPIAAHQPVSRQFERDYYAYYGWPVYWAGPALWGPGPFPLYGAPLEKPAAEADAIEAATDAHLRSVREVCGYRLHGKDGEVGHVEDLIFEDKNWAVRYLVVATGHWLSGKRVLVAPPWITEVNWERSSVAVDLHRAAVQQAPEYDKDAPITRDYEIELFHHYSREGYWEGQKAA